MSDSRIRVLYSFPHKIGAGRICYTAWQQVLGLSAAGADVTVFPGAVARPLPDQVTVTPTLARGRLRVPYRVVGQQRALELHDRIVAGRLRRHPDRFDIVHVWPLGASETLKAATAFGIRTVLERPNAHTRTAYELVERECDRIGVPLPPRHEHAFNAHVLRREEEEYELADALLCPSEFVVESFRAHGFADRKLVRHFYGVDTETFYPPEEPRADGDGLVVLFVGVAAVRKGLHFALDAWLGSPASRDGRLLIAGDVLPAYAAVLADELAHPSVSVLGPRTDVADLMRRSDVLVLPSIEEGFGLVCTEAMACGCVPLVSDACTELCRHEENALVHRVGDVAELERHLTRLHEDRSLLARLQQRGLERIPAVTWTAAGERLVDVYRTVLAAREAQAHRRVREPTAPAP